MIIDKERQIRNSALYLLPLFVASVLPLISLAIFTRVLTKNDFGIFALAQIIAIFFNGLGNLGMTAAYDRNFFQYRNDKVKTAQLLCTVILFVIFNFIILTIGTFIFKSDLSKFIIGSSKYGNLILFTTIAQLLSGSNYYYLAYFKNNELAASYAGYTICTSIINLLAAIFFVVFMKVGVIGLAFAQLLANGTIFISLNFKFRSNFPLSFDRKLLIEMLIIAYPLTPRIFLGARPWPCP